MNMDEIHTFLDKASEAYYKGTPLISDEEFDYLAEMSEYNKVGYPLVNKSQHRYRMYSLQKFYDIKDAYSWYNIREVVKTPKLDGAAVAATYYNGTLISLVTRGDGIEGEKISEKAHCLAGVLDKMPNIPGFIQVLGEVVAPKSIPNARNYVSGALHLKDLEEFKTRDVRFIAYGIYPPIKDTYKEDLAYLSKNGFVTIDKPGLADEYPTDGVVIRLNSNDLYKAEGYTSKHPKGAFALKDASDVVTLPTKLLEVRWQVGASGKVTPVAIFEEIEIDGAKINKATLHNVGFIEELELCLGDTLLVTRRGGIIPYVTGKL